MKKIKAIVMALCLIVLAACQSTSQTTTSTETIVNKKMDVVTTFYPVYYMTKTIAGDKANVTMLLDGSIDAHDFEPSAKDIATINDAKLFVYSSNEMETWAQKISDSLGENRKVTFVESGKNVEFIKLEDNDEHSHGHSHSHSNHSDSDDPHIWLEPETAKIQVNEIAKSLIEADVNNKEMYEKNRDMLLQQLDEIAKEYKNTFDNVNNKVFASQHAAFGYIAKRYNLEQLAVSGLQDSEPTPQNIAHVIEEIKEHNITAIYVDPSVSQSIANTVAKEANVSVEFLYTMETPVSNMDYLQILKANLEALKKSVK